MEIRNFQIIIISGSNVVVIVVQSNRPRLHNARPPDPTQPTPIALGKLFSLTTINHGRSTS